MKRPVAAIAAGTAAALTVGLLAACDSHEPGPDHYVPYLSTADVPILSMGNSHSVVGNVQSDLQQMVAPQRAPQTVEVVPSPGMLFLDERYYDSRSMKQLRVEDWSYVILQGQKYGAFDYSTAEAKELIRIAREEQHAVPILFPEWARLGVNETMKIYDLHVSIAQEAPACVAPIGQAWDLSLSRHPQITLHDPDGNHSNENGGYLTALILFATITGASPLDAGPVTDSAVTPENQALLRQVAADTVADWPPRQWCPDDPY